MDKKLGPLQNQLLAVLPSAIFAQLLPHFELVDMPLGKVLYESGDTLSYVYFPTDCIVSLLYVMENGASAEISVVGNEGMIGISLIMGGESTPSRAIVQSSGQAYRLCGQRFKDEFNRHSEIFIYCCAIFRLSSRKWPKQRFATAITPSINSFAAGFCCLLTVCQATS